MSNRRQQLNTFASTNILRMLDMSFAPELFALLFEALEQIRKADAIFLHDSREFLRQLWQEGRSSRQYREIVYLHQG